MQKSGTYNKGYAPKSSEAAPSVRPAGVEKVRPTKRLSVKQKGSSDFTELTGLFENISQKNGESYLAGVSMEDKTKYFVFTSKDKKTGDISHVLKYKDGDKLVKIATLEEKTSAKGNALLVGENVTGDSFYVQDNKPK